MLPYKGIWGIIEKIIEHGPEIKTSRRYKGFDEELFEELKNKVEDYYLNTAEYPDKIVELIKHIPEIDFTYRYKDPASIKLKLERNQLTKQLYKIANDILGMRFIIKADTAELKQIVHEFVTCCPYGQDACNIVDQTLGKTYDDGYKAIHVYIRLNNYVFPIEIQFWTRTHALLNEYLHEQIYKMDNDQLNQYALDLSKWLESVPIFPNSDEIAIKSYVDYIYEQAFSNKYLDENGEDIDDVDQY
ncbi:hypothetical protein LH47_02736 [Anoxybacillus thermarum]|uniref:RelA/SpoT domain-containing protein n=1 Tax=Anoxybacillus thermarum TaxID=404937 RepID=A0A0D0Q580_9BACL|nr:hypothetical protein [Anoxybacillus thermarum]KIQ93188.1 hypothetical protein LH47_02736 [Anoxybacillus thermarum]